MSGKFCHVVGVKRETTSHVISKVNRSTCVVIETNDGISISHDSAGVVRSWDISTGLYKTTSQGPALQSTQGEIQLIDDRLNIVWYCNNRIHIWDTKKGASPLLVIDVPWKSYVTSPVISRDGSDNELSRHGNQLMN